MNATLEMLPNATTAAELAPMIDAACNRIAPAWPLDRLIAVNPYWGFLGEPIDRAASELAAMQGTTLLMPRAWYRAQWQAGRFAERDLQQAITLAGSHRLASDLIAALSSEEPSLTRRRLMTDIADEGRDLGHEVAWGEYVTRHVSQTCAACFDEGQAQWAPEAAQGLYRLWRELGERDGGPRLLMGLRGFGAAVAALSADPIALIVTAVEELEIAPAVRPDYFTALLLSVNGWAAACAFRRWDARLAKGDDDQIVHLLAVRLAWELVLYRSGDAASVAKRWRAARHDWAVAALAALAARRDDWLVHRALEVAYQENLAASLAARGAASRGDAERTALPSVQAVFCIDVRSEVFRRALEGAAPAAQTLGFAGFFGLPIVYRPLSGPDRPQLPGLLAASLIVDDAGSTHDAASARVRESLDRKSAWKELSSTAGSAFSFVESAGLGWAAALVRDGFGLSGPHGDPLRDGANAADGALHPQLAGRADGAPGFDLAARVSLAAGILGAMSLTREFAPIVAFIGHGASSANNPQLAGLHCGACGGQSGEVNARALASLLNDSTVRAGLAERGIDLAGVYFVAGLHDTTTDDVTLYDLSLVPPSHHDGVQSFVAQLGAAGGRARRERAASLGLGDIPDARLDAAVRRRAADWSEVRPEWGLAGNAAFIVAPRERTRSLDLGGRSFLHEYRWEADRGFGVLELIMTAPMVVTHWINMQYHASTVDNARYGSGNKTLHNVVGGRLGVMEGAGGDLRIGLAMQSVYDGNQWMHEPLRLNVYIEAPADAIDGVLARHAHVRALVENEWLFLHRIDPAGGGVFQRRTDGWHSVVRAGERPRP
jgi:uncharacterized protein YbcC (UPF0753/DUF2309 family)